MDHHEEPDSEDVSSWRGCSMKEIYRSLPEWELNHVPPVRPTDNHTVLYHWPVTSSNEPPKPQKGFSKWDALHVRLPCSSKSQYPVTQSDGTVEIENRWHMIEKALLRPIKNSRELETAILSYNSKYQNIWKFRALHKMFEEELDQDEASVFFENLLPEIIRLALRLPELVTAPIPLLKQGQNRSISMSQQQVACLLANAFLCTFPRRNTTKKKSEYSSFPDINFNRLFQSSGRQVIEKLKCICHYFRRVCNKMPSGVLTFTRRSLKESELPKWEECNAPLGVTPLHITASGTIEDQGHGLLQVDFANKFLGGGVLGSGCVQEEIRFVICPELIISKLFTEALKPCEALLMIGCEQFSKYTGYASHFSWDGNFEDYTPLDESGRRQCNIVAIDALYFTQSSHQYREELMLRELNKAYVGFVHPLDTPAPGVASGNWGCGAFGGEASLKALIQLMACTITKRPLVYFTFGNQELRDSVYSMHTFFIENNITVKQLWKYMKQFQGHKLSPNDLYSFIIQIHCDNQNKPPAEQSNSSSLKSNTMKFEVEMLAQKNKQQSNFQMMQICNSEDDNAPSHSSKNVRELKDTSSTDIEIDYFSILAQMDDFETIDDLTKTTKTSTCTMHNKLSLSSSSKKLSPTAKRKSPTQEDLINYYKSASENKDGSEKNSFKQKIDERLQVSKPIIAIHYEDSQKIKTSPEKDRGRKSSSPENIDYFEVVENDDFREQNIQQQNINCDKSKATKLSTSGILHKKKSPIKLSSRKIETSPTLQDNVIKLNFKKDGDEADENLLNLHEIDEKLQIFKPSTTQFSGQKKLASPSSGKTTAVQDRNSSPEDINYFDMIEDNSKKIEKNPFKQKTSEKLKVSKFFNSLTLHRTESSSQHHKNKLKNSHKKIDDVVTLSKNELKTEIDTQLDGTNNRNSSSSRQKDSIEKQMSSKNIVELKISPTSKKSSSKSSVLKHTKDPKQRSLLDMFDVYHTERPAKRHCVSSTTIKK